MNDAAQQAPDPNVNPQVLQVSVGSGVPEVPAATPHKEAAPVATAEAPIEFVQPSEVAPAISPEVAEAGVEAVAETPVVTSYHKEIGIEPAKESVPVQTQPTGAVSLPKTQQEAELLLKKNSDTNNSFTWLVTWLIRQFKLSHQKEQKPT